MVNLESETNRFESEKGKFGCLPNAPKDFFFCLGKLTLDW